jgi:hypothetical protein
MQWSAARGIRLLLLLLLLLLQLQLQLRWCSRSICALLIAS